MVIGCICNLAATVFFVVLTVIIIRLYCCVKQQYSDTMDMLGNDTEKEGSNMYNIYHYMDGDCYKFIASFDNVTTAMKCCELLNQATSIDHNDPLFPEEYRVYDMNHDAAILAS